jgi:hypothetical protein
MIASSVQPYCSSVHDWVTEPVRCSGREDPNLLRLLPKAALAKLAWGGRDGEGPVSAIRGDWRRSRPRFTSYRVKGEGDDDRLLEEETT